MENNEKEVKEENKRDCEPGGSLKEWRNFGKIKENRRKILLLIFFVIIIEKDKHILFGIMVKENNSKLRMRNLMTIGRKQEKMRRESGKEYIEVGGRAEGES